ncbi:MAG: hypothetical protein NTV29_05040 [Planctomycetota bacterium]|nr:hypothetical protein [Planctomycetota bacterium]
MGTTDFQSVDQWVRRTSSPSINGYDGLEVRRTILDAYAYNRLSDRWTAAHPKGDAWYCEQARRDKADTAVVQAARRRVRAELRQGK